MSEITVPLSSLKQAGRVNLFDYDLAGLQTLVQEKWQEPKFRALQLIKWIHQYAELDFEKMTTLSAAFRAQLAKDTYFFLPEIIQEQASQDGTVKWLLKMHDGSAVETVFIPEKKRGTLCVSSQVGCTLDCKFCSTGKQGFKRNLTTGEIIVQLWFANHRLEKHFGRDSHAVTNVVMMGMGEPLLNMPALIPSLKLMLEDNAYGLSKYRVTVSTSGVVPAMNQLRDAIDVSLAVSLHAPNDALRDRLVPINKKYNLSVLKETCQNYFANSGKRTILMEYVMLKGVNDSPKHARELITLLQGIPCKVNLIPFNPFPNTEFECSDEEAIYQFASILQKAGVRTTVRTTRGDDIDAACGQLVGEFEDKTSRRARHQGRPRQSLPLSE